MSEKLNIDVLGLDEKWRGALQDTGKTGKNWIER